MVVSIIESLRGPFRSASVKYRQLVDAGPPPENACARVPLSGDAAAAQDAAFAAYYAQDHWFDNYHDSVWDPGVWCSKFLKGPQTHVYIMGAGCFDSACVLASAAAFAC